MAKRGRQTKLTPEITKRVCEYILQGNSYEVAAQLAGISERSFHRWKARGQKEKSGRYWQFWQEVSDAIAKSEAIHVQNVLKAATQSKFLTETTHIERSDGTEETRTVRKEILPDWGASKWMLSKRFPERWGTKKAIELSTEDGKPLPIQIISEDVDLDDL